MKCPVCGNELKKGVIEAKDVGSLTQSLTMLTWYPEKYKGKLVKKKFINDQPMPKNSPTDKMYVITNISMEDFEKEKQRAKELITLFYNNGREKCSQHPHSFFGKLTPDEWGILQWKHFDHHLRQFGA